MINEMIKNVTAELEHYAFNGDIELHLADLQAIKDKIKDIILRDHYYNSRHPEYIINDLRHLLGDDND